jgi:hypothetical protein
MFYFSGAATIGQLLEVFIIWATKILKGIREEHGRKGEEIKIQKRNGEREYGMKTRNESFLFEFQWAFSTGVKIIYVYFVNRSANNISYFLDTCAL